MQSKYAKYCTELTNSGSNMRTGFHIGPELLCLFWVGVGTMHNKDP